MLEVIHDIGRAIRDKFHCVPKETPIYLFIDNAGGLGTTIAKEKYVKILEDHYNVKITWQVLNSPETNIIESNYLT